MELATTTTHETARYAFLSLAAGHEVRVLSRQPRPAGAPAHVGWVTGDLLGGDGLVQAVAGVGVIVHCAGDPLRPRVDVNGTRNLLGAARATGSPHLIYISIVGVDRVPYRYRAKLQAERLIQESGLPWTILRATQFHQLVLLVAAAWPGCRWCRCRPPPASSRSTPPRWPSGWPRSPPNPPPTEWPTMGGPQIRPAAELLGAYLDTAGRRRPVLPVRLPGAVFAGYRRGGHLAPDRAVGRRTWEEFLTEQVGRPERSRADRTTLEGRT